MNHLSYAQRLARRSPGRSCGLAFLALQLCLGCCTQHQHVRDKLLQCPPSNPAAVREYCVGCPDILWISVEDHPEWSGRREVEANGCIDLGTLGGVRVEGLTVPAIQERLAALAHVPVAAVNVGIDEYCSQQVYLFGEVTGLQRAVAYQGPETITDLLRRVGGITEDSAPAEVRVVRNTRLEQAEAEVYRVDLRAILMDGDLRTNLTLQPYDQIYVPENKQAKVGRCLHPWLRPVGRALCPDS